MVELVTVSVPALSMPPPSMPAELSPMVELVTVSVPSLSDAAAAADVAAVVVDGGVGDRQRARRCRCRRRDDRSQAARDRETASWPGRWHPP